jgi:hypothetical protein
LFGSLALLSRDDNGDNIPDLFLPSVSFNNSIDIYKSQYWITKGFKPGFNIYIENKLSGTSNTSAVVTTNAVNI